LTYDDPSIFYLSVHRGPGDEPESEDYFYPGTGKCDETGGGIGVGSNLNIGWNLSSMGNIEYAAAFSEVVLPVMRSFGPDLILVASGLDAAAGDLLGDCGLTPEMYYIMTKSLIQATGPDVPIVVALEGGYALDVISECMEATALALFDEPWKTGTTTERDVENSLARYWRHEMMQSSSTNGQKALMQAITSIKRSARALAFSQSPLFGSFNLTQGGCTCRGHCKKRPSMLDCDRYPVKKAMLVRCTDPRHRPVY